MKDRISKAYANTQMPAKHLSLLKGRIHYERAHISAEFLPILVLMVCKLSALEYSAIVYLMSHCSFQNESTIGKERPALAQLSLKLRVLSPL